MPTIPTINCHRKLTKWLSNGVLLILVVIILSLCLLNLVNVKLPAVRCEGDTVIDAYILHKYNGDTVRVSYLIVIIFLVPLIQIMVMEMLQSHIDSMNSPIQQSSWKRGLQFAMRWYREYAYGVIFLILIIEICKSTLNAPRPHFVDTCKPNFTKTECNEGWVDSYTCSNSKISNWKLADSHKSFPSGHAALGMFSATFMTFFQHHRLCVRRYGSIVILWCHISWLGWGAFCAISRVADFRHHPIDVFIGGVIGVVFALFTVKVLQLSRQFSQNEKIDFNKYGTYPHSMQVRRANGSTASVPGVNSSLPSAKVLHQSISMPSDVNGTASGPKPTKILANTPHRPSLQRLLSNQSTLTQMTEVVEDREMDHL